MSGALAAPAAFAVPLPTRRATCKLARALGRQLQAGDLVILSGALGAGKTFFTRALARSMGLPRGVRVTSPTFALVQPLATQPALAHADLYRLGSSRELDELGLLELRAQGSVLVVEWGERFERELGGDALTLTLGLNPRHARLGASGPRSGALQSALARALAATPVTNTDPPRPG
jgi:tRNA threonylcarbamoyladenosine biosynthesis protein TsaE